MFTTPRLPVACATVALTCFGSAALAADELPSPLRLADVLDAVSRNNPELAEKRRMHDAAARRPAASRWPDDPMLMLEWWQQPIDFATVPLMLTVKQPIPIGAKLRARRDLAERQARSAGAEADAVARRIEADAKRAYFEMVLADRNARQNDAVRVLVDNLVHVVDARYRVGMAVQADLLKAQGELLMLENERLDFERDRLTAATMLNRLMNRAADAPLGPTASEPDIVSLPPAETLVERALSTRPEIKRAEDAVAEAKARLAVEQKENLPELAAWGGYMVNIHGVDTFTVGVQTSLPIFSSLKKRSLASAAELEVQAATRALEGAQRETEGSIRTVLLALDSAGRHVRLHADKMVPLSELTLQSALASYEAGRVDFLNVLEAARGVREHHTDHIKYLVEYQRRLAELEQLAGDLRGGAR
jgi:outer membrane protein TolC